MKKFELIAPAGNYEKMETAFAFGADAVYLGIPDFSLRVRINDFTPAKIEQAIKEARRLKKKVYVTINIFAHNKHLEALPKYLKFLKKSTPDALIISDPGIISIVKKVLPKIKIHLSTQANCTNWRAAEFWQKQGVKRIVLGREVTLKEIKEIHLKCPKLELEYFCHGAMCMAYSGRCFLSKLFTDRSANLGDCSQPCRWEYFLNEGKETDRELEIVQEEHGTYLLNSKDLCLIKYLDKLISAGITSFKIEGRAKSVYYQAVVVNAYRQALYAKKNKEKIVDELFKELNTRLVHRGYTTGFLFNDKADQNLSNSHEKSAWEFCGQVLESGENKIKIRVHNTLKVGDEIEVVRPFMPILKFKLAKLYNVKTGQEVVEAHGGDKNPEAIIVSPEIIPIQSVLRRKIK